ncbi:MAG: caspase family protein [Acidobacteriota bacterium]|nr:caspase family protein [Acidobacteriota bacterium]
MRHIFGVLVALLCALHASAGVRPVTGKSVRVNEQFDPAQSAALFVGVREFPYDDTLAPVRYAVDDAIDLAFAVSRGDSVRLVEPSGVILALSGEPQKKESANRLRILVTAGAKVKGATQADILTLLKKQARSVGRAGALIVSFSTHGISEGGTQLLLTASSILADHETMLTENKVRDIITDARVQRSLLLLDACRQRLRTGTREGQADKESAAALRRALGASVGHVVLAAAAPGQYAYDDDARQNGVFTAAVMEGLQCGAATDENGFVTAGKLGAFVEDRVLAWIQKHRDPSARKATQLTCEGMTSEMPLAACRVKARGTEPAVVPRPR